MSVNPDRPLRTGAPSHGRLARLRRPLASVAAGLVAAALVASGALLSAAPAAGAAPITVDQCNGVLASPAGATTLMECSVVVVNTISHGVTSSTTTVTRRCLLGPCAPGNGTFTTRSTALVTRVLQCNGSGNDAAHRTTCSVTITNRISGDTPRAKPVSRATSNQCVGSATGGGGALECAPYPAATTGATITQCNGSGNGGGGTVHCTVPASTISAAIPVTVNQCNGTANPGGSVLVCSVSISTTVLASTSGSSPAASSSASSSTGSGSGRGGSSGSSATSGSGSSGGTGATGTRAQVRATPLGGVAAGDGPSTSSSTTSVLGALLLGLAGVLALVGLGRRPLRGGRHS